jgi:hypothetical protein
MILLLLSGLKKAEEGEMEMRLKYFSISLCEWMFPFKGSIKKNIFSAEWPTG